MRFHVLTLFPDMVRDGLSASIIGRAVESGIIGLEAVDIRDFSKDKHKKVDDYTYGGGAGLLMQAQPVYDAHRAVTERIGAVKKVRTVYLTPQGTPFNQRMAEELSGEEDLILLCGHYEGIDERVLEEVVTDYVSLGDFVLTGGELGAMVMVDAIARLVPGVLHNEGSAEDESFSGYLLEYPQYSRPEEFLGKKVPQVLLSGDHKKIRQWRVEQARERTRERRPDLYALYEKIEACKKDLEKNKLHHMDMIALIERGQGKLLYHGEEGTLLQDRVSGAYFLTARDKEAGRKLVKYCGQDATQLVVHQDFLCEVAEECLGFSVSHACTQVVYTKKESLPAHKADIRRLSVSDLDTVYAHYTLTGKEYLKKRLEGGYLYGVYVDDTLAGFVGEHEEGSAGMLVVLPKYRRQGLAVALETDQINRTLKRGFTPFGQIFEGNEASVALQQKLGLYPAKGKIWWCESEKTVAN